MKQSPHHHGGRAGAVHRRGLWRGLWRGLFCFSLCLAGLLTLTCSSESIDQAGSADPSPAVAADGRVPVPEPDLSAADPAVREQIGERRERLAALFADPDAGDAELAEGYGDLGLVYIPYDFLAAAEACFDNARALAPEEYRWVYLAGYLRRIRGDLAAAVPLFERALTLEPRLLPARLRLGRTHLDLGDPRAARQQFAAALELDPQSAAAHEGLGRVAVAEGDRRAAVESFERALELQPDASGVRYALGQAYRDLGDLDRAREALAASGDVVTRVPDPLINPLAELAAGAQFYIVQGGEALDDGDFESAAAAFRAAAERDPASVRAHLGWAYSLERMGDAAGAIAALERGVEGAGEAEPDQRADLLAKLGSLLVAEGDDAAAIRRWQRSLELDGEQPAVHLRLADALARQKRFAEAVEHYDATIRLVPEQAAAVLERRATALINLGRGDEAVADFRRALEAAPDSVRLRRRFAAALEFLGDDDAAAAMRREAARRERANMTPGGGAAPSSLTEQAAEQIRGGDLAAAEATLRRALEASPDDPGPRYALASLLGHSDRFDEAIGEFRRVIEMVPRHGPARRGEIVALVLSDRYGEARVRLQEALRQFPRDAELALTQVRLLATAPDPRVRDGELAVEIVRRVAADRPDDPSVRAAQALAYAAAGRTAEALALQSELVPGAGGGGAAAELARRRLAAFDAGSAWVAQTPHEILVDLGR